MCPQMRRRLHRGPGPPAGHDLRRDIDEQTQQQTDRPRGRQLAHERG